MSKPQIIIPDSQGIHNASDFASRLDKEKIYRNLKTVIVCPTRGVIPAKVVQNWQGLMKPMNTPCIGTIFIQGLEVGEAYNQAIEMCLNQFKDFKFLLTIEEDNMPPPDGLLKLYEGIDQFDAIGGLYFTKGEGGQPMCYGNPKSIPIDFVPQIPQPETITECNGLGMGFTLFRLEMFKDKGFEKGKWFKTLQQWSPQSGASGYTQDLYFFQKAKELGYKFACDSRVKVGHYDYENDIIW